MDIDIEDVHIQADHVILSLNQLDTLQYSPKSCNFARKGSQIEKTLRIEWTTSTPGKSLFCIYQATSYSNFNLILPRCPFEAAYFSRGWSYSYPCQWAVYYNIQVQWYREKKLVSGGMVSGHAPPSRIRLYARTQAQISFKCANSESFIFSLAIQLLFP